MSQLPVIPLLIPDIPDHDELAPWLRRIDENRHYTNFGPLNDELCQSLATLLNDSSPHSTPCHVQTFSNGTAALTTWLLHSVGSVGALVLVPGITFSATAHAILASGNIPLIADIDPDNWLLTTECARTAVARYDIAAVIPVAAYGTACDASAWDAFTEETGVPVLIDAAGAFGNQKTGEHIDIAFSLHATKALAAGEGGAIVSASRERIQALSRISNFGIDPASGLVVGSGINAKLSEYHAAVALAGLARWEENAERRRDVMTRYQSLLATHCPSVRLPCRTDGGIYTLLPLLLPPDHDAVETSYVLAARNIQSRRWYCPPLHRHPAFAKLPHATSLPICDRLGQRLIGLPFYPQLSDADMQRVVFALADCLSNTLSS